MKDHCHLSGKFKSTAHIKCNLKIRYPKYNPVLMHNLPNCDIHFVSKELRKYPGRLNIITEPQVNTEAFFNRF